VIFTDATIIKSKYSNKGSQFVDQYMKMGIEPTSKMSCKGIEVYIDNEK
jgi:hypothetical protein